MLTRQCDVTLGLIWQYVKQSRRVKALFLAHKARVRDGWRVTAYAREVETSDGMWGLL